MTTKLPPTFNKILKNKDFKKLFSSLFIVLVNILACKILKIFVSLTL